jgi:hypothetical protein
MGKNDWSSGIEEYFLRKETLNFYSEKGNEYPDRKYEFDERWRDVFSVSLITNAFTLTGLLTPFAPYYLDASNPEPCKGWAIVMGLSAVACSEFIRNYFGRQFDKEKSKYKKTKF